MSSIKPTPRVRPAAPAPPNSPRTEEHQGYRRGRAIRSCLECRRRKMRCNRSRPCQNCNRFCRDCVYYSFPEWPSGASINVKVEGRSQSPDQGVGRALPSFNPNQHPNLIQPSPFTHHHHHHHGYHPDTFAKHAEHDGLDDIDADSHSLHVGLQIGRLGITEKINGFLRPDVATQVSISHSPWAKPYCLTSWAPGESLGVSVNIGLCRLRLCSLKQSMSYPLTAAKLPIAHLRHSIQPAQRPTRIVLLSNESYPSSLHLAF